MELIAGLRERPTGRMRLVVSPLATSTVLAPKLGRFARDYPDVILDVTTSGDRLDIVAMGFDAGIHLMEFIEKDMAAVRVSPDLRPPPSRGRPASSSHVPSRRLHGTCWITNALMSVTDRRRFIGGSSRRGSSRRWLG